MGSLSANAQKYTYKRIYDEFYDEKPVHFGFLLGFGSSRFRVHHASSYVNPNDPTLTIVSPENVSFSVGGIANFTLNRFFDIKSGINIALYGRGVDYTLKSGTVQQELRESTWLEIPILLKYKSLRRGNSRMFVDAGFKFGFESNVRKNALATTRLNANTSDISVEYGIGFEQFFKYFKFTPELRFSHGLTNLYVPPSDPNSYANDIQKLYAHSVTLYLMFE